jgi:hypothetical protein
MLFGNPPIEPAELLQIVTSQVPARAKSEPTIDWTQAVKEVLCELGLKLEFKIYASIHLGSEKHREWLLDVVWYSPGSGGIHLAVECEWGEEDEVLDDFEKIMCTKSPLKLMLFSSGETLPSQPSLVQKLQEYLADSEQNVDGELYLLVDFSGGEHRCYEFRVLHHGKLKANEIEFRYLEGLSGPDVTRGGLTCTARAS